jgi:hypothetical protein
MLLYRQQIFKLKRNYLLHNILNLLSKRIKTNPESVKQQSPKDLSALMDISDK